MKTFYNIIEFNDKNEPIRILPVDISMRTVIGYKFTVKNHSQVMQIIEQVCAENTNASSYNIEEIQVILPNGEQGIECILMDTSPEWISYNGNDV